MYLIALIIVSLVFYVYLKIQQLKARGPMEFRWYSAKGSIAIGLFFISSGMAAYLTLETTIAMIVAIFFSIYGLINLLLGLKNYRYYLPYAQREVEQNQKQIQ